MTATLPTQEQADRIARELEPDVVRIRFNEGPDWSEHPSLFFRVLLADEASRGERLREVSRLVRKKVADELRLDELEHIAYFNFRNRSEQAKLQELSWD